MSEDEFYNHHGGGECGTVELGGKSYYVQWRKDGRLNIAPYLFL